MLIKRVGFLLLIFLTAGYQVIFSQERVGLATPLPKGNPPPLLLVGADATLITPEVNESWTDSNGDSRYSPAKGDTFFDRNGNHRFDAVWLAGFQNDRPAQGIHDPLWARTIVLESGGTRLAIVSLDLIGLLHDQVREIRDALPPSLKINYLLITSTHTHSGPDTVGIWGRDYKTSGFDPLYWRFLKNQVVNSVLRATRRRQPARMSVRIRKGQYRDLVEDDRRPLVIDDTIGVLRFTATATGDTIATLVNWSNHPDSLGGKFLQISSDFPGPLRKVVEKKVGGMACYISGSIGGQIEPATPPDLKDVFKKEIKRDPFWPARVLGERLGALAAEMALSAKAVSVPAISVRSREIQIPLYNPLFRAAAAAGIIPRKSRDGHIQSEVSVISLGPVQIICVPGEIYPEIIIGGVVSPPGADFPGKPVEVPPLKELMKGKYKFVFGLANDEIGYIIPRTEWDDKPPFLYGAKSSPYGEINSVGPDAARIVYRALADLLQQSTPVGGSKDSRRGQRKPSGRRNRKR